MGRTKQRVRAQRKFAQGAFVPPQSNPPSSGPPPATLQASHRLVSGPSLAPVVLNQCSPRDLVTRMSLGRIHSHDTKVPIVLLERNEITIQSTKRKLKERRNFKTSSSKRRYPLRTAPRINSILRDSRRVSVSDSGEDTPLSSFLDPVASLPAVETVASDVVDLPSPSNPVESSAGNDSSEILQRLNDSTMPNLWAVSGQLVNPDVMVMIPDEIITAKDEPLTPLASAHSSERSPSRNRSVGASEVAREQLLCEPLPSQRCLRSRRTTKPNQSSTYHYSGLSDVLSDVTSMRSLSVASSQDPEFRPPSVASSECSIPSKRYNTLKRKALNRERARNNLKKNKKTRSTSQQLVEVDECSSFTSTSETNSAFLGFQMPNIDSQALTSEINMSEINVRNIPITTNLISTATWVINQSEMFTSSTVHKRGSTVAGSSRSDAIGSLCPTIPGGNVLIAPERHCLKPTNTEQPTCNNDKNFKMPKLPVRFAKRTKNCPTRSFCDLQELLKSQPTEKDPFCNICKRCELINKFKKVASQLPVSLPDEPDILEQRPRDVYEFDSDEGGMKSLKRGRELVRNVLTTNKFPIWLSNLEMNLQTSMFQKEHKLGTLKRTIILEPNDIADEIVRKIILRVDYLARCIAEDKKELDEQSKKSSPKGARSSAVSGSPRKKTTLIKRKKQAKVVRAGRKPRKLAPVPTNTALSTALPAASPTTLASVDPLDEAGSDNPLQLVCVTPIEDCSELRSPVGPVTPPVSANSIPNQDSMLITQNDVQSSAPVSQPLLNEGDNAPLAQSSHSEEVSTSLTQIEPADCPSPNQQENEFDIDSSLDQPPIQESLELPSETITATTTPTPDPEMNEKLVYRPTVEEFQDPIIYIKKIEEEASKYGICKIIPPEPLNIPCNLDENCMFKTVNQYLGRLFQRWGSNCSELVAMQTYVAMLAQPREREQFTKVPLYDGLELDLVKLYRLVLDHGGIEVLLADNEKWARIAEQMSLVSNRGKLDLKKLEKIYCKHVLPYESLTFYDRKLIRQKINNIWALRLKAAVRRAKSPIYFKRCMLGYVVSEEEEDDFMDAELQEASLVSKPCFERIEECIAKGRTMNLSTFRRIAAHFQAKRFSGKSLKTTDEIEADYWQILSLGQEHVCVLSAWIDTSVDKLGHTSDPAVQGSSHPWNLKRLSDNPLNILRWLGKTLSVTVPTLTVNQLYSTNCWHRDPHNLAWLDYMHEGAKKIWYGVPSSGSRLFRAAVESQIPSAVQTKGTWLSSDTTMLPPGTLIERGVPVHRILQRPGEFIVVFPGAYASSIATGHAVSESIYFENQNWLNNIDDTFRDCEPAMFSHTLLLMRMAREPSLHVDMLRRVYDCISVLILDEFECRREAVRTKCRMQLDQSERTNSEEAPVSWPNQLECSVCRTPLVLSKMNRLHEPRLIMCMAHGLRMLAVTEAPLCTEPPLVTMFYSNEELHKIISDLELRLLDKATPFTKGTVSVKLI